jgi:lactoylglutathione lyase
MDLAKPHIDVGLFTDDPEPMLAWWRDVAGLAFEEMLPMGGGLRQHRHAMNGSVLKINASREALPPEPAAGYRVLLIAREGISAPQVLTDPEGNQVMLVPGGADGVAGIALRIAVRDLAAGARFYRDALQCDEAGSDRFRCGDSLLMLEEDPAAAAVGRMTGRGYRYITMQVRDVDAEHRGILERGGTEGRPPVTLGTTARISFVRDPDGNWIEISQRASLTGPLPQDDAHRG